MRMRCALLLCVFAAACGGSGSKPGGTDAGPGGGGGIKNNHAKQPCAIVVQFDGTARAAVPDPASCSSDADVWFVFVNGDGNPHDFTIDPTKIYNKKNQQPDNPFNSEKPVTVSVDGNSVRTYAFHTKNKPTFTTFTYTVEISGFTPLDPDIEIMM